jgi:hypothetical protein
VSQPPLSCLDPAAMIGSRHARAQEGVEAKLTSTYVIGMIVEGALPCPQ